MKFGKFYKYKFLNFASVLEIWPPKVEQFLLKILSLKFPEACCEGVGGYAQSTVEK